MKGTCLCHIILNNCQIPNILYFCRHFSEHIYIDIMSKNKLNLLVDFPEVTTEEWMEVVKADLKGADFDKKLLWKTNEGFNVKPFYRAEDIQGLATTEAEPGKFPYVRGTKPDNNWFVRQDIVVKEVAVANKKLLNYSEVSTPSILPSVKKILCEFITKL